MLRYNKLKELNVCDAYLIVSDVNRFYLSGFKSSYGYVVYAEGKNYFLTDFRYGEEVKAFFESQDIEVFAGTPAEVKALLQNILADENIYTIGYEDNRIFCNQLSSFQKMLPNKQFMPIGQNLDRMRYKKDEYEIAQIEAAQRINDKAFNKILDFIKPGMTEFEIKVELEYQLHLNGAEGLAFDTIVASGPNTSRPHSHVSRRKVAPGDFIILDFGAKYNGYCSDMTRTIALGKPSQQMEEIYNHVLKAQTLALNALKAQATAFEVYSLAKEYFTANGYGNEFLHGLGHSVGIEIHEAPSLNSEANEVLENNMVLTVEPGLYLEKNFGVRIEDLVVIKEQGIKNLTASSKDLIII